VNCVCIVAGRAGARQSATTRVHGILDGLCWLNTPSKSSEQHGAWFFEISASDVLSVWVTFVVTSIDRAEMTMAKGSLSSGLV
jgi:hypothetical protein